MPTQPPETIYVAGKRVSCDGGGGALGHPRVWLEMGEETAIECPYCSRLYILKGSKKAPAEETPPSDISADA